MSCVPLPVAADSAIVVLPGRPCHPADERDLVVVVVRRQRHLALVSAGQREAEGIGPLQRCGLGVVERAAVGQLGEPVLGLVADGGVDAVGRVIERREQLRRRAADRGELAAETVALVPLVVESQHDVRAPEVLPVDAVPIAVVADVDSAQVLVQRRHAAGAATENPVRRQRQVPAADVAERRLRRVPDGHRHAVVVQAELVGALPAARRCRSRASSGRGRSARTKTRNRTPRCSCPPRPRPRSRPCRRGRCTARTSPTTRRGSRRRASHRPGSPSGTGTSSRSIRRCSLRPVRRRRLRWRGRTLPQAREEDCGCA